MKTMDRTIKIWNFEDAPEYFRRRSEHGGDEDGICFVPSGMIEPWWLERLWDQYGEPQRVKLLDGTLVIWAHA